MLYENKTTGEYGLSIRGLRLRFPNFTIPDGIEEFEGWTAYREVTKPYAEYANIVERQPKNGLQVWEVNYNTVFKDKVQADIYSKIDDACEVAIADFNRFRNAYYVREADAKQYIQNNYGGEVGALLKGFADAIGMSYKEAADLVMKQSEQLRSADIAIEDLRMRKYTINYRQDTIEQMIQKRDEIIAEIHKVAALVRN